LEWRAAPEPAADFAGQLRVIAVHATAARQNDAATTSMERLGAVDRLGNTGVFLAFSRASYIRINHYTLWARIEGAFFLFNLERSPSGDQRGF